MAIAGPSCGGKTELAHKLVSHFEHRAPGLLRIDSYYQVFGHLSFEERSDINFDEPDAVNWDLLIHHLEVVKQGGAVQQPVYDYVTHTRTGKQNFLHPGSLLIVEGLFSLNTRLLEYVDHRIFVQLEMNKCLKRRIDRDVRERGRSEQSIRDQFRDQVAPMYDLHVAPTINHADLIVSGEASFSETLKKIEHLLADHAW